MARHYSFLEGENWASLALVAYYYNGWDWGQRFRLMTCFYLLLDVLSQFLPFYFTSSLVFLEVHFIHIQTRCHRQWQEFTDYNMQNIRL